MKLLVSSFSAVISALALMLFVTGPAQATRTFVSATGDDNNPVQPHLTMSDIQWRARQDGDQR